MKNRKRIKSEARNDRCKVRVSRNGPYLVSGRIPMIRQIIITDTEGIPN